MDEDELPGIGRRYTLTTDDGGQVCVVIHHTGRRDLYVSGSPTAESQVVSVEDDVARRLGAAIAGSYFTPAAVRRVESAIGGLVIDWVTVPASSALAGSSIADAAIRRRTRVTVAAIIRGDEQLVAPDPDEVVVAGDQLVLMGRPEDLPAFRDLFLDAG